MCPKGALFLCYNAIDLFMVNKLFKSREFVLGFMEIKIQENQNMVYMEDKPPCTPNPKPPRPGPK